MRPATVHVATFWAAMQHFFELADKGNYGPDFIWNTLLLAATNRDVTVPWMARILPDYNDFREEWEQVHGYMTFTGSGHYGTRVLQQLQLAAKGVRGSGLDGNAQIMLPLDQTTF